MTVLRVLTIYVGLTGLLVIGALLLQHFSRLGAWTKPVSQALSHSYGLDLVVAFFTVLPLLVGGYAFGAWGLLLAVGAEVSALLAWVFVDERGRSPQHGTSLNLTLGLIVGKWRNHAALWVTTLAVPVFWAVRVAQYVVYPPLTWLVKLPSYDTKDWVNVSRHKFSGLIGYDLVWCLYCDWMTGVWSLGTEMLRNVESLWCPIRFSSEQKCENCKIDFPDITSSWVPSTGTMADVSILLHQEYDQASERSWHGHPSRQPSQSDQHPQP